MTTRRSIGRIVTMAVVAVGLTGVPTAVHAQAAVPPDVPVYICGGEVATIVGTGGPDTIVGTPGNDVIVALGGRDLVAGQGGNDIVCLDGDDGDGVTAPGDDLFYGATTGNVTVYGGPGRDQIFAGNGNDHLYGGDGPDTLSGNGGADRIWGEADQDQLTGGPGDDILLGGAGADRLTDWGDGYDIGHGGADSDFCQLSIERRWSCETTG
jgi:Ca2+-binding RTX toxin-like protein